MNHAVKMGADLIECEKRSDRAQSIEGGHGGWRSFAAVKRLVADGCSELVDLLTRDLKDRGREFVPFEMDQAVPRRHLIAGSRNVLAGLFVEGV